MRELRAPALTEPASLLLKRYPVQPARLHPKPTTATPRTALILWFALLVVPSLALFRLTDQIDWRVIATYLVGVSIVTFVVYGHDKRRAQSGGWRTPESTLHLLEFAGGWPAAFVAQRFLRHKTSKTSYQIVFGAIVLLHQVTAADFLLGWRLIPAMLAFVRRLLG